MGRLKGAAALAACCLMVVALTAARKSTGSAGEASKSAAAGISEGTANIINDMATTSGWNSYVDNSVTAQLTTVAGKTSKAMAITYNFNTGLWLSIARSAPMDLSKYKGMKFTYKGEGAGNTFEIKFEDSDGSNFGYVVEPRSNASSWTDIDIPFSELKWWWGGDQTLDLKRVRIHLAVSKRDNDEGGQGRLIIGPIQGY